MDTADFAPIEATRFRTANPTADSLRLLGVAYDYLDQLETAPVLGICVFSSISWGIATPASDIDIGFILPDGEPYESAKREFRGEFIDHCEWPWSWIDDSIDRPLKNHILSYALANALIIFDPKERLSKAQRRLEQAVLRPPGAQQWQDFYLDVAAQLRKEAHEAFRKDPATNLSGYLFTGVRRCADAVLHRYPGGHCGEWPQRLREYASATGEEWLHRDAVSIITPTKADLGKLTEVVEPLEELHLASAVKPSGVSLGCSRTSGKYFARKARFCGELRDFLSLLHVLRRQIGYIRENLNAKPDPPSADTTVAVVDLERVENDLISAWPAQPDRNEERLRALDDYAARADTCCRKAPCGKS